uniref:Uncharacterized protein n=1 Tax=Oryza brachyantha TaxID=4533 RepID=J3MKE3_ORYBR
MNGGSPVMTESERATGVPACVCAPTTHAGSFRCKHHRHASNLDADAKRQEAQQQEVSSAEQEMTTT